MTRRLRSAQIAKGAAYLSVLAAGTLIFVFLAEAIAKGPVLDPRLPGLNVHLIQSAKWSHNDKKIALFDDDDGLRVLDTSTGRQLFQVNTHNNDTFRKNIRWSYDDAKLLIISDPSKPVRIVDASTGQMTESPSWKELEPSEKHLPGTTICAGGDYSITRAVNNDGTVVVSDGEVWQGTTKLDALLSDVWICSLIPRTQYLIAVNHEDSASRRDLFHPSTIRPLPYSNIKYLAASNDGKRLALGSDGLFVFDLEKWREVSKSAFRDSDWITVSDASNHYASSEQGDSQSTVTFKTILANEYRLRFYRSDLREDSLQKAWSDTPTSLHPKFFHWAIDKVRNTPPEQIASTISDTLTRSANDGLKRYSELGTTQKTLACSTMLAAVLSMFLSALWVFSPHLLTEYALASEIAVNFPVWKRLQNWLLLAAWLGNQKRPLDAWLRRNKDLLFPQCFADRNSVKNRSTYVDLGNESDATYWDNAVLQGEQSFIQIIGPGGCGKTSLAVEWSRRTLTLRLSSPIIPIIVDEDWQGSLLDYFARSLSIRGKRPTPQMVKRLGKLGRISILIDGLSERRGQNGAINQALELATNERFKYILLTSRTVIAADLGKVVKVAPLSNEILYSFVSSYVNNEAQKTSVLATIAAFSGGKPVRPLFAKLAIEQFATQSTRATTVAELVQNYILALRQPAGLREGDTLRAARLAARACVWEHLVPLEISTEYLHGQIAAEAARLPFVDEAGVSMSTSAVFDHLVTSGLMQKSFLLATMRVKFALDPIAEYLVAMDAVASGGNTLSVLRDRIAVIGEPALGLREIVNQLERERELMAHAEVTALASTKTDLNRA